MKGGKMEQNSCDGQRASRAGMSDHPAGADDTAREGQTFPEQSLAVRPWADPVLDMLGHDPRSLYVERFWVSIIGPTSTLLLRRLATGLELSPAGFEIDCLALAHELGLGLRGGKNSPFWRAIDRTSRFNATQRQGRILMARTKLAPLTLRQTEKLPPHLQSAHRAYIARQLAQHQATDRPDAA
jgi:hypothetical protein